ncbi:MAG TPA: leucine/isoleucine/valine transporter permease subunit [Candidatus Limnocylindria bacterium]|nr:leucine/isoleucine/valine transporter permease subunit [Candidatus Limnocylindria bacterium]
MDAVVRRGLVIGLLAGVANVHVSLVGLLISLQTRQLVAGIVTLGSALPLLIALLAGYLAGRYRSAHGEPAPGGRILLAGALAGLVSGGIAALLVVFITQVNVSWIFVNASARLVSGLHFDQDMLVGSVILVVASTLAGLLGAALHVLPRHIARALSIGLIVTLVFALMEPFLGAILRNLGMGAVDRFLFSGGGLTQVGAVIVLAASVAITWAWRTRGAAVTSRRLEAMKPDQRRTAKLVAYAAIAVLLLLLPQIVGQRLSEVLTVVGIYVLLGLGLNIVVGFAGLLDLGYVAFYAVGAYTTAVLTSPSSPLFSPELSFWAALPFVIIAAALIGLMVGTPVLRLRGDYLAIVTLGFGEIARIIFLSEWAKPVVGGAQGILSIPAPLPFERDPQSIYYPILIFCVIAALGAVSLANSRVGRAWNAMREDESVAEATGVSTVKYKLLAFGLGAAFGCLSGALFAAKIGTIFPNSFDILVSINALALIILGGMGNIFGVVLGAAVLVGLPELLREFSEYRLLIYGAVLVVMMILRPEGLLPSRTRRAELHEREDEEEQFDDEAGVDTARPLVST